MNQERLSKVHKMRPMNHIHTNTIKYDTDTNTSMSIKILKISIVLILNILFIKFGLKNNQQREVIAILSCSCNVTQTA
jgi:hypothetical protein